MKKPQNLDINIKNVELFATLESDSENEKGIYASDHYGILAEIDVDVNNIMEI